MPTPNFVQLLQESDRKKNSKAPENPKITDNVAALVKELEVGKSNAEEKLNVKMVPRNKLRFNKDNDFEVKELKSLAKSILSLDVISIPSGYYDEAADEYVLENGERRTRAIDLLIETYKNYDDKESKEYKLYQKNIAKYEKGYPFRVMIKRELDAEITEVDDIDSRLRLLDANIEARDYTEEERRKRILEKMDLIKRREALLGISDMKSSIIKDISESEGVSTRQAYKYAAADSLIPELRELFVNNQFTLNDGEFYSKLSVEEQQKILELIQSGSQGNAKELFALQQELKRVQEEKEQALAENNEKIEKLMQEKHEVQESLSVMQKATQQTIESNIQEIREKLETEYKQLEVEATEEQQKKVKSLEMELETMNSVSEKLKHSYEQEHQQNEKKELEIKELKKRIKELNKPVDLQNITEDLANKVKKEMSYKFIYETVGRSIKDYKDVALTAPIEKEDIVSNIDSLIASLNAIRKNFDK